MGGDTDLKDQYCEKKGYKNNTLELCIATCRYSYILVSLYHVYIVCVQFDVNTGQQSQAVSINSFVFPLVHA